MLFFHQSTPSPPGSTMQVSEKISQVQNKFFYGDTPFKLGVYMCFCLKRRMSLVPGLSEPPFWSCTLFHGIFWYGREGTVKKCLPSVGQAEGDGVRKKIFRVKTKSW